MKRILLAALPLMLLAPISAAQAEVVQEFNFQLKSITTDGRFTVVFTSRTYDTTGAQPPVLTSNILRLPAGAVIRPQFLNKKFYCDVKELQKEKDPKACDYARLGQGRVLVDARPFINEPIPVNIYLFFAKGTVPGAVASFAILGIPDANVPIVKNNPVIRDTKVVVQANFVNDPTPDGVYGYKLVLPTGPIQGINISIAEVNVTTQGLTQTKVKRKCEKKKRGKCVKKKVKKKRLFWFTQPTCPPSGKLSFQAEYGYASIPTITKTIQLPCPNFSG